MVTRQIEAVQEMKELLNKRQKRLEERERKLIEHENKHNQYDPLHDSLKKKVSNHSDRPRLPYYNMY